MALAARRPHRPARGDTLCRARRGGRAVVEGRGGRRPRRPPGPAKWRRSWRLRDGRLDGTIADRTAARRLRASASGQWWSRRASRARRMAKGRRDDVAPKYIFVTGGVVSSLGKGLAAASIGALLEARGLPRDAAEDGSVHQRGRGDHEPLPARRGLRDRRRRRDRPRSRALRALHLAARDPRPQRHHRQGLLLRHPEGAPRGLPRTDGPGDSAHHRRDQGVHPAGRATTPTSSSSRWAAPSATSRACPSWRPSASSGRTSGARTSSTCTSPSCPSCRRPPS